MNSVMLRLIPTEVLRLGLVTTSLTLLGYGSVLAQSMVPMPSTPVGVGGDQPPSITYDTPRAPALGKDPNFYPPQTVVPHGQQTQKQDYGQPVYYQERPQHVQAVGAPAAPPAPMIAPVNAPVNPPVMTPVMAPAPMANIPNFTPVDGWYVTKTTLSQARGLQGMKLPCLMTAQYDNGFTVRLSGGGGSILAMAIDFRQSVFKQGKKYQAAVTTGGMTKAIEATAFAPNILLFSARDWPGFYAALSQGSDMVVDVEGNVMRFMMSNIMGGLSQLEQCFNPAGGMPPAMPVGAPLTPMAPQAIAPPPTAVDNGKENWQSPRKPALSEQPRVRSNEFHSGGRSSGPASKAQLWTASAGETLDVVLARWGATAGVDVSWQAGPPIPVQSDFQFRGGFTQAVQTLMAQNAAISGLKANLVGDMATASASASLPPTPLTPMGGISSHSAPMSTPPPPPVRDIAGRWSAPEGASLQGVLSLWAEQEGVDFVWQSSQNFALTRGINASGAFENAVQAALEQFSNERLYPTARLNTDPKTGQRVLFVFSSRQ